MPIQDLTRSRRITSLVAGLGLLAAAAFAPAARAQSSGTVEVSAEVATILSLTLCDTEANFGTGLTSLGNSPSGTTDLIDVTAPAADPAKGAYYMWTPSCQAEGTGPFVHVVSTSAWSLTMCATENNGTGASPTLKIANGDLRFDVSHENLFGLYDQVQPATMPFVPCEGGAPSPLTGQKGGLVSYGFYYLQVDPSEAPGAFKSTTTWTLTPS
jgi:hypothetical protein